MKYITELEMCMDLTPKEIEAGIIREITEWSSDYSLGWDGIWKGFNTLSEITGIPINKLKKICRKLKSEGKLELREIYNQDGQLHGRGYFIP